MIAKLIIRAKRENQALLIIHPTLEARLEAIDKTLSDSQLKKDHPDVLWIGEEEKLGVEAAKKIRQHLSLKPYSAKGRAVVVEHAHEMTHDAQNSLLKTLEEPPLESMILLGADSDRNILPTVLSRVSTVILGREVTPESNREDSGQVTFPQGTQMTSFGPDIEKLLSNSIEERFLYIEKLEEKEAFFHGLLTYFHGKIKTEPKYLDFIKELFTAEGWIESNGNIRAILEYLMLKMPIT